MPLLPNRSAVIDSSTTIVSVVIPGSSPMRFSKARAVTERPPQKATSRPNREGASARLSCRQSWPLPPLAAALVPPLSRVILSSRGNGYSRTARAGAAAAQGHLENCLRSEAPDPIYPRALIRTQLSWQVKALSSPGDALELAFDLPMPSVSLVEFTPAEDGRPARTAIAEGAVRSPVSR
jgi:hypothetical protein